MTEVLRVAGEDLPLRDDFPVSPSRLAQLIGLIANGTVSGRIAKDIFADMLLVADDPQVIVERKGLAQLSDQSMLEKIIDEILAQDPSQVEKFQSGNEKLLGFFVGRVMEATKGKANPALVNTILLKKLSRS
jgi:aspartyl-tRNA(Asn)/glutamyl-tRNA(Gln) amidotransferase subunit B